MSRFSCQTASPAALQLLLPARAADKGILHIVVVIEQAVHIIVFEVRLYFAVVHILHDLLHGESVTRAAAFLFKGFQIFLFFIIFLLVVIVSGKKVDILRILFEFIKLAGRRLFLFFFVEVFAFVFIFA